jgi:hypothetical protein
MWANAEKVQLKKASFNDERLMNPKGFGGFDHKGDTLPSKDDMFDSKGNINAYDKSHAVHQQIRFAELRDKRYKTGSFYTQDQKEQILAHAFSGDPNEMRKFASEMIPLIIDRLDYEGFSRQVLRVHEVPQGQIISYEKDVNVTALVINENGQTIPAQVQGNRVFPAEKMITSNPRIPMAEIYQRQFDVVDRAHDKATFQIMLEEDRGCLKNLYDASTLYNTQIDVTTSVNKSVIETIAYEVERWRLNVDKFIINRKELGDIRTNVNVIDYSPEISRDVMMTGIFGSIWGYNIFISAGRDEAGIKSMTVPEGVIFAVAPPQNVGAMPIRIGLQVLPADQFVNSKVEYGWMFVEQIGQIVLNPRAVAVGVKTGATIPSYLTA